MDKYTIINNNLMSLPISIPKKKTIHENYNNYSYSIPKYGSFEGYAEDKADSISKKCSESSDFPNIPFGKTPPDEKYKRDMYLDLFADNNLRYNLRDN